MKKLLALLMTLILTLPLLTGCSPEELAFMQLNQEISNLDTYMMTGTLNWETDLEALLGQADGLTPAELDSQQEIIALIENEGLKHIAFTYGVDLKNKAMEASYSAGANKLFTLKLIQDTYYVNFDGLLDMITRNNSEAIQDTVLYVNLETLRGKYLAVSVQDLVNGGFSSELMQPAQYQDALVKQQAMRKNMMTYFMDFAKTELAGHNPGLVKKTYDSALNADVYGYSVTLDQVPLLSLDFMLYLLDHLDGTEALVMKIVSDPTVQEQAGLDSETMTTEVKSAFEEIRYDLEATRTQLTEAIAEEKSSGAFGMQLRSLIGTATVEASLAKTGPQKYWNRVALTLDHPEGEIALNNASLDVTVVMDGSKSPSVQAPDSSIPFKTFNDALPHTLVLEPDYNSASYDAGLLDTAYLDVDMINAEGHWFISLGSLPEHFRDMVKREGGQLMIGDRTLLEPETLLVSGDLNYIALSAFQRADVLVTWDDADRTLTLEH